MKKLLLLLMLGTLITGCIDIDKEMTYDDAVKIAHDSHCVREGALTSIASHNEDTQTWWITLDPYEPKPGCNPACVVYEETQTADINWRCTGGIPPITPMPINNDSHTILPMPIDSSCARNGETFSRVSDKHLDSCCAGLKEWLPIPDTRFSIADVCYEVGSPSESNIGLCIKCGNGVCENHLMYNENPCNCPEDCKGKSKSMFQSIDEFCQSNDWIMSLSNACENQENIKDSPICRLC